MATNCSLIDLRGGENRQAAMLSVLRQIGRALDGGVFPRIQNGGVVVLSDTPVSSTMGTEKKHAKSGQGGPAARPRERASGRARAADRPANPIASLVDASVREAYEAGLDEIREAYPGTLVWTQSEGMWLIVESAVIAGLDRKATFLLNIPWIKGFTVRAWAFWTTPISRAWIGPRHTNMPDGSICAFEPRDMTWHSGESLVQLVDIYTLWALRHLHLELLGSWPGPQAVTNPFERLAELKDDEPCGCDEPAGRYAECCKNRDLRPNDPSRIDEFFPVYLQTLSRQPPAAIARFVEERCSPPPLMDFHFIDRPQWRVRPPHPSGKPTESR